MIIDVHTHAFPDSLAPRAVSSLEEKGGERAYLDGTIGSLLSSMDGAGIALSVVCSVATNPLQFSDILRWSHLITSPRIIPLPSVHPRSPSAADEVRQAAREGFAGLKLHPEYQDFYIDDPALANFYEAAAGEGLILLFHAGFDIGFPDSERSSPGRIAQVHKAFPELKIIASHLGGFRQWEEAGRHLIGADIYLDTSYIFGHIPPGLLEEIIRGHRPDRILFGSDSPWTDQEKSLEELLGLGLPGDLEERILSINARKLFGLEQGGESRPEGEDSSPTARR